MPILPRLKEYLDTHQIKYQVLTHSTAYTAQEVAQAQHVPGKEVAKVVMVKKEDGTPVMLVLPASHRVDFTRLREVLGTKAELEQEREFRDLFPGCETGAEPPFGNLFNLETIVDTALTLDEEIVFNAGSHWQTVRMRYDDYARLVRPRVATFAQHL
jgi:Ala-tRNA(Pro) deacylase